MLEHFIKRAKEIHGNKYDYSKFNYIDYKTPSIIICKKHGEFKQSPNKHLSKRRGCHACSIEENALKRLKTTEKFISDAILIHGDKYDYSKTQYKSAHDKVTIICKKHGEFEQTANDHLSGHGCSKCQESKLESEVKNILLKNNIKFEQQKRFDWLGRQSLDFYLPEHNIAIECQGEQHYRPIEFFGGNDEFQKIIKRDNEKLEKCKKNNIEILYYDNKKYNSIYLFENKIIKLIN